MRARARDTSDVVHVLRDYVLLADGWRGALVSPEGSMTWLCFPGWSDPAVFAELLGSAGTYTVAPSVRHVPGGYYEDRSLIWRRRWVTADGLTEVREAMAYPGRPDRAVILRRITAVQGETSMRIHAVLAHDYGRRQGRRWERRGGEWYCRADNLHARLIGVKDARTHGVAGELELELRLSPGTHHDLVMELSASDPTSSGPLDSDELWRETETAWRAAIPAAEGLPANRDVRRSFAVLRGLTNAEGATVAAATTSLPERADGGRDYDYRYAWIRDTCYIGHAGAAVRGAEAVLDDAVQWVSARLLSDGTRTMPAYRTDGRPVPEPSALGVPGYPGGSDTIGNRVGSQFQLDLFGESLLLFANAASKERLDADGWRAAEIAVRAIEEHAAEKECGIWEIDEPDHWTHSRLICVAGLRAVAEHGAPSRWRTESLALADRLLSEADRDCIHRSGRWQRTPTDERVDASLLLSEIRAALPPDDPRSVATREAILRELCQDEYIYRYAEPHKDLGDDEGAFLICNFWMALAELRRGELRSGSQWFERARASCSTSGLFSEEYDVAQRQLRGNLPQAFVHALLIETAAELAHG